MRFACLLVGLLALFAGAAVAQSPNAYTVVIPGKGVYVSSSPTTVGTFVPGVEYSVAGRPLIRQDGTAGNDCTVCQCCKKADTGLLREHLTRLGHKDLANDSQSLEKAMEVDVSKLPKQP